jgi:hypothetical protein
MASSQHGEIETLLRFLLKIFILQSFSSFADASDRLAFFATKDQKLDLYAVSEDGSQAHLASDCESTMHFLGWAYDVKDEDELELEI